MVCVAPGCTQFEAKVIVARLGAAGVLAQLRGFDPVYPVGRVDVLVPEDEVPMAWAVLGERQAPDTLGAVEQVVEFSPDAGEDGPDGASGRVHSKDWIVWVALVTTLLLLVWTVAGQVLRKH